VQQLFVDFKKGYDSVMREVLYNSLIEFDIAMKPVKCKGKAVPLQALRVPGG
jgi:hypothetical protein